MDTPQTTTEAPMDVTTSSSTDSSLAISTRPTSDSDPASSLRAAALLTLKTKRRKVVPASHAENPTPTTRPPPPDNQLQLDYGQDDTTPLSGGVTDSAKRPSAVIVPSASNLEDGQAREEGEISDEEDQSSPPSVSIKPKTSGSNVQYARARSPASDVKMVKPQPSTPPRQAPPTETLSANSPSNWSSDNIGYAAQNSVPAQPTMDPAYIRHVLSMVDEDHVRPGLTMNQTQYDHAKDIILDLLGWGVTPEHLVEYGLSREIIYYTFNELNLRLPENLATADLVPYPPYPEMLSYPPPHQPSEPTPLRFHTNGRASSKDRSSSPRDFIAPVPSAALSGHPSSSTSTENLHDIERQRRQELLARKAVQASRKSKQNQTLPDLQLEAKVSKDSVDDFLKAITSTSLSRQNSLEMDVDDAHYSSTDVLNMPIDPPESSSSNSSSPLASTPQSPRNLPNATASSATSDSTPTDDIRILRQTVENSVSQRRGQKRPVASDFVDFDAVPRGNGTTHSKQRKTRAGFAGHGAVRRFVIDISDSEGDDEIYAREPVGGEQDVKNGRLPFGQSRPIPQSATVPNAHRDPQGSSSVGVMSPASLVQKELEIQRMRELIAQREQKLAAVCLSPCLSF
ncbi:hypothetical protein BDN72DRAFT_635775 [Pluteus cervinus]|uniref:Uncharacterized protein n=1 Tax=Pluteus cervinus TaxID=181527 RepID=A0ACD3BA13_9AGAR|nr:hypothetical protein BDN72DRAFT_635775 [Pluteus cervinus]